MFDELDDYKCPHCGCSSESCFCEDETDFELDYSLDPFYDDYDDYFDYDQSYHPAEPICYLDGKPLYKEDIEQMDMVE